MRAGSMMAGRRGRALGPKPRGVNKERQAMGSPVADQRMARGDAVNPVASRRETNKEHDGHCLTQSSPRCPQRAQHKNHRMIHEQSTDITCRSPPSSWMPTREQAIITGRQASPLAPGKPGRLLRVRGDNRRTTAPTLPRGSGEGYPLT